MELYDAITYLKKTQFIVDDIHNIHAKDEAIETIINTMNKYKSLLEDLISDIEDSAYILKPTRKDYAHQGITECMILDVKSKIADDLEKLYVEYQNKLSQIDD